jgi:hypothetical protein
MRPTPDQSSTTAVLRLMIGSVFSNSELASINMNTGSPSKIVEGTPRSDSLMETADAHAKPSQQT